MIFALPHSGTIELDQILNSKVLRNANVGVCVMNVSGEVLYEKNAHSRFIPASNQKVFSVLYALDKFGPDHTMKTKIWKSAGRIDVECSGDPSLTLQQLRDARKALNPGGNWPIYPPKILAGRTGLGVG